MDADVYTKVDNLIDPDCNMTNEYVDSEIENRYGLRFSVNNSWKRWCFEVIDEAKFAKFLLIYG